MACLLLMCNETTIHGMYCVLQWCGTNTYDGHPLMGGKNTFLFLFLHLDVHHLSQCDHNDLNRKIKHQTTIEMSKVCWGQFMFVWGA